MTEAEKIAKFLEDCGDMHSAALIREQEAKIARMAEALRDYVSMADAGHAKYRGILKERHADALRDARCGSDAVRQKVIEYVLIALFMLLPFVVVLGWVYATVSVCGWKGFFVECRITSGCTP